MNSYSKHSHFEGKSEISGKPRSISKDLTIILVLIVVFISIVITSFNLYLAHQKAISRLEEKADDYLAYLVGTLEPSLWYVDTESVMKIGNAVVRDDLIARLRIVESNGHVAFEEAKGEETILVERSGHVMHDGQAIGHIEIGLTSRLQKEYMKQLLWSNFQTLFIVVFVIIIITQFLLRYFLNKPIGQLMQGIERIAKGDYDYHFSTATRWEIQAIISKFTDMGDQIQKREKSLTQINEQLKIEAIEREQAEEALREAYHIINRSPAVAFLWKNAEGWPVEFVSDNVIELSGYTTEEYTSGEISYARLIHPDDLERVENEVKTFSAEEGKERFIHEPYRIVTKDGEVKWLEDMTFIRRDEKGNITHYQGIVLDISERVKAEDEKESLQAKLQRSHKMEAMGTLAGGIAHDFNNLLLGIQGRTSIMKVDIDASHPHSEHVSGIEESVKSATNLTKQLLGFARGGKYEVKPIAMNYLVKNSSDMFGRTKKEIKIHLKLAPDLWAVEVDQGQIEQVLLNLYVNAWQAMPAGGELYLHTENTILDEDYVMPYLIEPGKYVKIIVTDTGTGMDEATQHKIFDPFFTTKEMGRGTGLGLASAYGIVKNHNGIIDVYSVQGKGTTFNIYLPASDREAQDEVASIGDLMPGSETVLLIDDEKNIIDVGRAMLEKLGYTVMVAVSGRAAIDLFEQEKEAIDIVILDMIMSGISGAETFARLRKIDPAVKVLLSSGYSINGQAKEILDEGCDGFIQKPFSLKELSHILREILDS
jgi:PAS domain S-box-containing protein